MTVPRSSAVPCWASTAAGARANAMSIKPQNLRMRPLLSGVGARGKVEPFPPGGVRETSVADECQATLYQTVCRNRTRSGTGEIPIAPSRGCAPNHQSHPCVQQCRGSHRGARATRDAPPPRGKEHLVMAQRTSIGPSGSRPEPPAVDRVLRLRALRRPVGRERTYRTFTFATGSPAANPYLEQRIRDIVGRELAARGLEPTASSPDLVAVTHVITYEQRGLDTWYSRATPCPETPPSRRLGERSGARSWSISSSQATASWSGADRQRT